MKKLLMLVFVFVCALGLGMFGLVVFNVPRNGPSINYIIDNKPKLTGTVKECNDNAILIENKTGEYWISRNTEVKDSTTHFNPGDEIVVYYDGSIAESYPMQINNVYYITLYSPPEIIETITSDLATYFKMSDGTWQTDTHSYQYRLEITGRMQNAAKDCTFVYLSNLESISFEQAWKASGLSSNLDDYFSAEEAVLVDMILSDS